MQAVSSQFLLVGKLFILMGIGVFLRKRNIITETGKKLLTDLIIDLILPCSIISAFLVDLTQERLRQTGEIFFVSLLVQLVSFLIGRIIYRKCVSSHQTVMQYATVCSNSGILGTPIAEGIFGIDGTLLAAVFLIPLRVVMWTLGLSFFAKETGKTSIKKVLTHPCIAAVLIGLFLMVTHIPLPALLEDCIRTIGGCNTAFSMILVGSIVADMSARLIYHKDTLYYSAIRLIALPLLTLIGCECMGVAPLVRNLSVILTAMPAGATTSILALKYNADAAFASACTALTTVLSLLAVPLWCAFLL